MIEGRAWRWGGGERFKNVNGGVQTAEACVPFGVVQRIAFPLSTSEAALFVSSFHSSLMPPPTLPRPLTPLNTPKPPSDTHTEPTHAHPRRVFYGKPDTRLRLGAAGRGVTRASGDRTTGGEQKKTREKKGKMAHLEQVKSQSRV